MIDFFNITQQVMDNVVIDSLSSMLNAFDTAKIYSPTKSKSDCLRQW